MLEKLAGLYTETMANGQPRHRVLIVGTTKKITLQVGQDHPQFREHYHAARAGVALAATEAKGPTVASGSLGSLITQFSAAMDQMVDADRLLALTAKNRMAHLNWLRKEAGQFEMDMPRAKLMALRDKKMKTPGAADTFLKAVRAMYRWALDREIVAVDPTVGIKPLTRDVQGATPWTEADLAKYITRHPEGTPAHLALMLLRHTACRISDAIHLGRQHETTEGGITILGFQPEKRGSTFVTVPMDADLYDATRAVKVVGSTYLLTDCGKPFSSKTSFGNKFRDWVKEAGLIGKDGKVTRSPHGIRKATGGFMAEAGASVYEIMAVHGHSSPQTSAIYTKGANRAKLAAAGLARLRK